MLSGRGRGRMPSHRNVALARDIVEILAIVAAGIWAIYVFVYTDKIEPFTRPHAPKVDSSIGVVGAKGGLLAVRLQQSIENTGPSRLYVLGSIATISGQSVRPPSGDEVHAIEKPEYVVRQRFHFGKLETAYSYFYRHVAAVEPGARWEHSWIIFIPRTRYDVLIFDPSFAFTSDAGAATSVRATPNSRGILTFDASCTTATACPRFASDEMQLSLWPPALGLR
jgi:hypothetical protein